jgi:hypothetical protein
VLFGRHRRRRRRLLVSPHWQCFHIVTETASSTRVEVRLGHYGLEMDLRQAVVVAMAVAVVVAVHTVGVGEDQKAADDAVTAVWWGEVGRSMVDVVERRAQQVDKTSAAAAAVLVVGMGLGVHQMGLAGSGRSR